MGVAVEGADGDEASVGEHLSNYNVFVRALKVDFLELIIPIPELHVDPYDLGLWLIFALPFVSQF